jgi:hypothetical protein
VGLTKYGAFAGDSISAFLADDCIAAMHLDLKFVCSAP